MIAILQHRNKTNTEISESKSETAEEKRETFEKITEPFIGKNQKETTYAAMGLK